MLLHQTACPFRAAHGPTQQNSRRMRYTLAISPKVGGNLGIPCRKGQAPSLHQKGRFFLTHFRPAKSSRESKRTVPNDSQNAQSAQSTQEYELRQVPEDMGLLHKAAQNHEKHLEWYPKECLKSRMRQSRTYGSVRGGGSNASRLLDLLSCRRKLFTVSCGRFASEPSGRERRQEAGRWSGTRWDASIRNALAAGIPMRQSGRLDAGSKPVLL